jgi:hypothetical protein
MKMPRRMIAMMIPMTSASCWSFWGTRNFRMMSRKTKRLSTDSEYSVSHPAKNSPAYWLPEWNQIQMPKAMAAPT